MLSPEELQRYARSLPLIGVAGQERLQQGKVLVVGAGGLGCPAALYLAAAGVGTLGIADHDRVALSNLSRQILHTDPGKQKVASAQEALARVNPHVRVVPHPLEVREQNVPDLIAPYDVVLDGADSLPTKHILNQACRSQGKPLIFGAAVAQEGLLAVFTPAGACLACLIKARGAPACAAAGVLPVTTGLLGLLQAGEALKILLGQPPLEGLLVLNARAPSLRTFSFPRNPRCSVCGGW